jgi:hypothetical protein
MSKTRVHRILDEIGTLAFAGVFDETAARLFALLSTVGMTIPTTIVTAWQFHRARQPRREGTVTTDLRQNLPQENQHGG